MKRRYPDILLANKGKSFPGFGIGMTIKSTESLKSVMIYLRTVTSHYVSKPPKTLETTASLMVVVIPSLWRISSFLSLSRLVTPRIVLRHLISNTRRLSISFSLVVHASEPYISQHRQDDLHTTHPGPSRI